MFFQETMMKFEVCFLQGNTLIGTHWEFTDAEKIIALMESANYRSVCESDTEGAQNRNLSNWKVWDSAKIGEDSRNQR